MLPLRLLATVCDWKLQRTVVKTQPLQSFQSHGGLLAVAVVTLVACMFRMVASKVSWKKELRRFFGVCSKKSHGSHESEVIQYKVKMVTSRFAWWSQGGRMVVSIVACWSPVDLKSRMVISKWWHLSQVGQNITKKNNIYFF